jgi:hypothetical protein
MQPEPLARSEAVNALKLIEEPQCKISDLMGVFFFVAAALGQAHDRFELRFLTVRQTRNRNGKASVPGDDGVPQQPRLDLIPNHGDSHP